MKIENLERATACAETWKTLLHVESIIHAQNFLREFEFGVGVGFAFNHISVTNTGVCHTELGDGIRDHIILLLDKRAVALLDEMKKLGLDTEPLEIERETMLNLIKADE